MAIIHTEVNKVGSIARGIRASRRTTIHSLVNTSTACITRLTTNLMHVVIYFHGKCRKCERSFYFALNTDIAVAQKYARARCSVKRRILMRKFESPFTGLLSPGKVLSAICLIMMNTEWPDFTAMQFYRLLLLMIVLYFIYWWVLRRLFIYGA